MILLNSFSISQSKRRNQKKISKRNKGFGPRTVNRHQQIRGKKFIYLSYHEKNEHCFNEKVSNGKTSRRSRSKVDPEI